MKKTVMYTETRTWFFDLDMSKDADLDKTMRALKDTNDPDYTEDFRSIAKRELKGENQKIVLTSLTEHAQ